MESDPPNTLSGTRLPDPTGLAGCRIEGRIAMGDGTRVYRAVDVSQHKTVALKMLTVPLVDDATVVERFLASASSLVGLAHVNIVEVLRAGRDGHVPYCVMEFVEGEDLERRLGRGPTLSPRAAVSAVVDAARGLAAAHARGVLHGDVRPGHLMNVAGDVVKVTGFGLSPPFSTAHGRTLWGSPAYLAPEAIGGGAVDQRADLYALGCTLYELLTGRPPFGFGGPDALVACHMHEPFPALPPDVVAAAPKLEELLGRLVAKKPDRRFADHGLVIEAGEALLPSLRETGVAAPALIIEEGRQTGLRIDLPEGEMLIGRVVGDGLALDDARVSRRHAVVRRAGGYIEVRDLDSRNGIRVNHVEVKSRQLFHGDRLAVGDSVMRVEAADPAAMLRGMGVQKVVDLPASPVRGAFGDVEVSHAPGRQATAGALWPCSEVPELGARLHLLAALAPVMATAAPVDVLRAQVLSTLRAVLRADGALWVPLTGGALAPAATSAAEASLVSTALPALERALSGSMSLATTVRRDRDETCAVALAPVRRQGATLGFLLVVRAEGRFSPGALTIVEAAASLLSARVEASPAP